MLEINMEREFRLATQATHLLNTIVSKMIVEVRCIAPYIQSAVPQPGVLCQAVVLQTENGVFVIQHACEDFGDIEVVWLSVVPLNEAGWANDKTRGSVNFSSNMLGSLKGWRAIEETITFERKAAEPLKAQVVSGLLFQLDDNKRLLVMTAPLPFFITCFIDTNEIDDALASINLKRIKRINGVRLD